MFENLSSNKPESCAVLLVDDNEALLAALQRILSDANTQVETANTGATALLKLAERSFDVVVSDIRMPGMTGLKLLKTARQHDLDLPIVLMTGSPDVQTATEAIEYGAFQYLVKPVAPELLRAVVDRAITLGRIARLKRQCADEFGSGAFYVGDRAAVDAKLDRALQSLRIDYQPILDMSDRHPKAYQAVLCSDEPALRDAAGILRASTRVNRVHEVGRAARKLISHDARTSARQTATVFVKIEPEDLVDPTLYLPDSPLALVATNIVIEFSDRAVTNHIKDIDQRIATLRDLGFRVAIGDLGAGHSGPSTFAQLNPTFVKLDVSLTQQLELNPGKKALVRSLIALCHQLGQTVIAEAVSSSGEWLALREIGCDLAPSEGPSSLPGATHA